MRVMHLNVKLAAIALAIICRLGPAAEPEPAPIKIGMPSSMFRDVPPAMFQALSTPLHKLVHTQTGLKSELVLVPTPDEMQTQLQTGGIQFGVFFGFEFAWVQQKSQGLQPLMVAAPVHRPLQAFLVVHATNLAKSLTDLKGQTLAVPTGTRDHTRLYAERNCRKEGSKSVAEYFGRIVNPANAEEALHDVADNKAVQAALVDWAALQCFRARNEGRFKMIKVLDQSQPFPESVVAIWPGAIAPNVVASFKTGMQNARATPLGRQLLTLMAISGFEPVPPNYQQQLAECAKAYPPPELTPLVPAADGTK
jgi:ABC-type phosphate/phosphonate transport system substrate-binding protein